MEEISHTPSVKSYQEQGNLLRWFVYRPGAKDICTRSRQLSAQNMQVRLKLYPFAPNSSDMRPPIENAREFGRDSVVSPVPAHPYLSCPAAMPLSVHHFQLGRLIILACLRHLLISLLPLLLSLALCDGPNRIPLRSCRRES
jgi:hypothetical protein